MQLSDMILQSGCTVFFGGAGVSTESGIPDFRSAGGLFSSSFGTLSPEEILSRDFFLKHTDIFYDYYRKHLLHPDSKPCSAHTALAGLEKKGLLCAIVTQNIDGLHTAAGSRTVWELHGSCLRNYCMGCGARYGIDYILSCDGVPRCNKCGGLVRPDVVLYGEALDAAVLMSAAAVLKRAELIIVGGTSLAVYPAAGLLDNCGARLVVINKTPTPADSRAALVLHCSVGDALSSVFADNR